MAKRMLADVLWRAANQRLWAGRGVEPESPNSRTRCESCCALALEQGGRWDWWGVAEQRSSIAFLRELGCDTGSTNFYAFEQGPERQGVRYMWLLLAMHVAEDDGIEIEVSA